LFSRGKSKHVVNFFTIDGARGYFFDGIFFSEGIPEGCSIIGTCRAKSNVQNTILDELRTQLAREVRDKGGNALVGFQYTQRANAFSWSNITWETSGRAALIAALDEKAANSQGKATQTKECPFCGEDILYTAKKCKHCGEFLEPS